MLRVDGEVELPREFSFAELAALPAADQVPDVSRYHPQRQGDGVTLESLLRLVRPGPGATYARCTAAPTIFMPACRSRPCAAKASSSIDLRYAPLPAKNGGPIRFLIKDPAACHTDELNDGANVKFVDRIELTVGRGTDNRPENDAAHERLHAGE